MFAYLTVENEFLQSNKTEDEIRRFTLEEDLGERKRSLLLLGKGESVQRRAIYEALAGFLTGQPSAWPSVLLVLRETAGQQEGEAQAAIARELRKLVLTGFELDEKQFAELFQFTVGMLEQWNEKSSDGWLQLFAALVTKKEFAVLERQAMTALVRLSDPHEIQPIRVVAAKAFGLLAEVMKSRVKGLMLDRMRSYCRDPDRQLRLTVLKDVFPRLYQHLPLDLLGMHFNERIFELIYDADLQVKLAALEFLFGSCELFPAQEKENRITSILIEHLEGGNEQVLLRLSAMIGEIYVKLRQYLQKHTKHMTSFLAAVRSMASSTQAQTRCNFLYNLPGLLYYLDLKLWSDVQQSYLRLLGNEECVEVRSLALLIFHQIVQICGVKNFKEYPQLLLQLLQEVNSEQDPHKKREQLSKVFVGLFENVDSVVGGIHRHMLLLEQREENNEQVQLVLMGVCSNLLQVLTAAYSLNKHYLAEKLNRKLRGCLQFFKSFQLLTEYVPLLLEQMASMNRITLKEELQVLCDVLYGAPRRVDIDIVLKRLHDNFLKSNSWCQRAVYIKICRALLECFSFQRYRELRLFEQCMALARDRVLEVRLECVQYVQHCLKHLTMDEEERQCCCAATLFWQEDPHFLMKYSLEGLKQVSEASADQQQHWQMVRDLRNDEKLRHENTLIEYERSSMQIDQTVKVSSLLTKKTLPPKQKKQYGSKYANKLKAKINISLSTNSLGMQNALRGEGGLKEKFSEKLSDKRECISAANRQLRQDAISRNKKPSIIEHIHEGERIRIRKKPSVEANTYQDLLRKDVIKRSSMETKKRRTTTEKRIE